MKHNELINRLVDRKMKSNDRVRAFCVCMAHMLCFGSVRRPDNTNPKK
jgi:hypothetical protein